MKDKLTARKGKFAPFNVTFPIKQTLIGKRLYRRNRKKKAKRWVPFATIVRIVTQRIFCEERVSNDRSSSVVKRRIATTLIRFTLLKIIIDKFYDRCVENKNELSVIKQRVNVNSRVTIIWSEIFEESMNFELKIDIFNSRGSAIWTANNLLFTQSKASSLSIMK